MDREHALALFAMTALVHRSPSPDFVNEGLRPAAELLALPGMPNREALALVHAGLHGRPALIKRSARCNYNSTRFELFTLLRAFVARCPAHARWVAVAAAVGSPASRR
jgi:hypothetical protein